MYIITIPFFPLVVGSSVWLSVWSVGSAVGWFWLVPSVVGSSVGLSVVWLVSYWLLPYMSDWVLISSCRFFRVPVDMTSLVLADSLSSWLFHRFALCTSYCLCIWPVDTWTLVKTKPMGQQVWVFMGSGAGHQKQTHSELKELFTSALSHLPLFISLAPFWYSLTDHHYLSPRLIPELI